MHADEMRDSELTLIGTLIAFLYPVGWLGAAAFGAMCMLLYAPRHKVLPFTLWILRFSGKVWTTCSMRWTS